MGVGRRRRACAMIALAAQALQPSTDELLEPQNSRVLAWNLMDMELDPAVDQIAQQEALSACEACQFVNRVWAMLLEQVRWPAARLELHTGRVNGGI